MEGLELVRIDISLSGLDFIDNMGGKIVSDVIQLPGEFLLCKLAGHSDGAQIFSEFEIIVCTHYICLLNLYFHNYTSIR